MVVEVIRNDFSEKRHLIRKSKGFTQEELAEKLEVSRQAVAKWESGQYTYRCNVVGDFTKK